MLVIVLVVVDIVVGKSVEGVVDDLVFCSLSDTIYQIFMPNKEKIGHGLFDKKVKKGKISSSNLNNFNVHVFAILYHY